MKKSIVIFISAIVLSGSAFADLYKVYFEGPSNSVGKVWRYGFVVDLHFAESGVITGEVKEFLGATGCRWPGIKIEGGNLPNGTFRWMTEENPLKGCGKLVFIGKKEGEKLVGYLPRFQGVKIDLELEPTK